MKRHFDRRFQLKLAYSLCKICGEIQVGWYRNCTKCGKPMQKKSKDYYVQDIIFEFDPSRRVRKDA